MKVLFDKVSSDCSRQITRAYSTSFSLSINFLNKRFHDPIYAIYGFVRLSDEIVDSFHDYNKKSLLQKLRIDTRDAIEGKISINPVLNSFQHTVHRYNIEWELVDTFLKSMEMDLEQKKYDEVSYNEYILGSAEVVGLMCLRVFTDRNDALYQSMKPYAMKLGAAFQKVNFLRDLKADYQELGRTYFPGVDFKRFSIREKEVIQNEIEADFKIALEGIKQLPKSSQRGVYLGYYYYRKLFRRIKQTPAEKVMNARIRIPDYMKVGIMFKCVLRTEMNLL